MPLWPLLYLFFALKISRLWAGPAMTTAEESNGPSNLERSIRKLEFVVLSAEQIEAISCVDINTKMLYDIGLRRPTHNGPLDPRLGMSTKAGSCETCGETLQNCAGHFGCIRLILPVYHIGFLRNVITILNCVCKSCGALLLSLKSRLGLAERLAEKPAEKALLDSVKNECKKAKSCPRCRKPNGTVKKNNGFRVYHELKVGKVIRDIEINPLTCLNILRLIEREDYLFLGIKHSPECFIIQRVLVPPACIRPSVDMEEEGFNEDDLTVKLSEIVNANGLLEDSIAKGNTFPSINDEWDMLQLQVSLFINSDLPSVSLPHTPIRGVVQRLKGKQGRFRCNLSGKRVDFTGRTVISPDPNLSVDEVGIPVHIAKILTVPERVTQFNRDWLSGLAKNALNYPGANYVVSRDKTGKEFKRFLMYGKFTGLNIGDVVERHLLDGDIVLFNRQPSLHRMSIMGHRARIHSHRTFRFNECDCASYNADFDGDEMNIHLPQTIAARAEAVELLGIRKNICSARNGEPLVSCTQDFLTGSYLLTSKEVFLTRARFAQLCSYAIGPGKYKISARPVILQPAELFTGKQIFDVIIGSALCSASVISAATVNLDARNRSYKSDTHQNEGHVLVRNNRYLKGRLDKSIIGGENRKGSLIYQLLKYSNGCAIAALNSISRVSVRYLTETGFSIGLDDVFPSHEMVQTKTELVRGGFHEVQRLVDGRSQRPVDQAALLEMEISRILSTVRDDCGNLCIRLLTHTFNSPVIMQECGSKGSKINISQMIACVAQQIVHGQRIPEGMHTGTLPHFAPSSLLPQAKGFVLNSFFTGLTSYEAFFHAVSGREGLVDTAVKTAETGYMQRRLMKALEDLSVKYDYTVRNSFNDLVQYSYGEDNIEPLRNEEDEFLPWIFTGSACAFSERLAGKSAAAWYGARLTRL